MKDVIKEKIIKRITNVLVVLLLLTFLMPYYANAAKDKENEKEEEKGRGAVPTAVGEVLKGITIVSDEQSTSSSSSSSNSSNYSEKGKGYDSVTKINGKTYKNYKQGHKDYEKESYWGGTFAYNACGPTTIAIIASGLGIDKTPLDIAKMIPNDVTSVDTLANALKELGISYEKRSGSDGNAAKTAKVVENLKKGNPVAAGTTYTKEGHWIAALGIEGNKVIVSDPGNVLSGNPTITDFISHLNNYILITQSGSSSSSSGSSSSGASDKKADLSKDGYTGIHKSGITGREFKEYKQFSPAPWAGDAYANGNTIAAWGCPLVSDAILCSGYGHDVTPRDINKKYMGSYKAGAEINSKVGFSASWTKVDKTKIVDHLKKGGTLMVHTYNIEYANPEHYMTIIDIKTDGSEVYLSNPGSTTKNGWINTDTLLGKLDTVKYVPAKGGNGTYGGSDSGSSSSSSSGSVSRTSNFSKYIKENGRGGYKIDIDLDKKVDELLKKLKEDGNKDVDNFLKTSKKKEYLKAMIKAELITQFPDLRSKSELELSEKSDEQLTDIKKNLPDVIKEIKKIENKVEDGQNEETVKNQEEAVFNSLSNTYTQEKIYNILIGSKVTKDVVHDYFYTSVSSMENSEGYSAEELEDLYLSYIKEIRQKLIDKNTTSSSWLKKLINGTAEVPEGELQGVVRIKRKTTGSDGKENVRYLSYMPEDDFTKKCESADREVLEHYTVNSDGGIIVAQYKEFYRTVNGDAAGEVQPEHTYEITQSSPISYLSQIYQHTMPFDLLWSLLVYGGDYNFIYDLANLVYNTDITITALDTITDTSQTFTKDITTTKKEVNKANTSEGEISSDGEEKTETHTITYTERTIENTVELKISYINSWIAKYINNDEKPDTKKEDTKEDESEDESDWINDGDPEKVGSVKAKDMVKENSTLLKQYKKLMRSNIRSAVQKYNNVGINVKAKTILLKNDDILNAYVDDIIDSLAKTDNTLEDIFKISIDKLFNTPLSNIEYSPSIDVTKQIEKATSDTKIQDGIVKILKALFKKDSWKVEIDSLTKQMKKKTKTKTKTKTDKTTYTYTSASGQIVEKTDRNSNEDNFVTLLDKNGKAKSSIRSIASWFFESIEKNKVLCDKLDLMKYLLGKAFGKDYGVDEFDFSIFDPEKFSSVSGNFKGGNIEEKVWYALRMAGYSEYATAGAMGNIYGESSFDPKLIEQGNGIGFGLCQWSFGRRTNLEKYAKSKGKKASDVDIQIEFLLAELTPGGGANGYASYNLLNYKGYGAKDWINAKSVVDATTAFMWSFERPGIPRLNVRIQAAEKYYKAYAGKDLSSFESNDDDDDSGLTGNAAKIIKAAKSKIGCKYVWGAEGPNKFDCGGLVKWCYSQAGISVPHTGAIDKAKKVVSASEARPGDILWKPGHVGICISNKNGKYKYIHAANEQLGVCESDWQQFSKALQFF